MPQFDIQILALLPEPYLVLSPVDLTIIAANPAYLAMVERSAEEIDGLSIAEIFPNTDDEASALLLASLDRCRAGQADKLTALRHTGPGTPGSAESYWDITNIPIVDDCGNVELLISSPRDVTPLHIAKQRGEFAQTPNDMVGRLGNIGAWSIDIETGTLILSEQASRIHGLSGSLELHAEGALALYSAPFRPTVRELFARLFSDGQGFDEQLQIIRPDGDLRWVRLVAERTVHSPRRGLGAQGAIQDITEHLAREHELALSSQKFRDLADAMPMMVWTAQPNGRIDFCNKQFEAFTGVSAAQLAKGNWFNTIASEDRRKISLSWRHSVKMQSDFAQEVRLRDFRTGHIRWHLIRAVPICNADGLLVSWYGTSSDIDEVKRLQEESALLAHQLKSTFDSITDAFMVVDRNWRFVFLTKKAASLLRREREELVGRSLWDEFSPTLGTIIEAEYQRAMTDNVTVNFETYYAPLDTWFSISAYPSSQGLAVYFRDVTVEKRQQQLIEENEERLRTVANASLDAIYDWCAKTDQLWWSDGMCPVPLPPSCR